MEQNKEIRKEKKNRNNEKRDGDTKRKRKD